MEIVFCVYLFIINSVTFAVYSYDKNAAQQPETGSLFYTQRIPEKILLMLACLYGSIGAILAMETLRHKTGTEEDRKKAFTIGIPLAFMLQYLTVLLWIPCHTESVYIICIVLYLAVSVGACFMWKSKHARENSHNKNNYYM